MVLCFQLGLNQNRFFSYDYIEVLSEVSECEPLTEHILCKGIFFFNNPVSSLFLFLCLVSLRRKERLTSY